MKKLANSSPPERMGREERLVQPHAKNILQHAGLEPAHIFIQCIIKNHWKVQMLIRNVNQITSTSVKVQLLLPGFHDTNLFVLLPVMMPNWCYYSNCTEFNARLVLMWFCSLAGWQLFRGKRQCCFSMYSCRKICAHSFHLKSRSTAVLLLRLAVLLDWAEREVKFQFMGCPDLAVYCAAEMMIVGGEKNSCCSCSAVGLSLFVFSLDCKIWSECDLF